MKSLLETQSELKDLYERYRIKKVPSGLVSGGIEGGAFRFESDTLLMKELWKTSTGAFSFNLGGSLKNVAVSVGAVPDWFMRSFEVHGVIANSWEDTFSFKFNPKFGVGITVKF